MATNISTAMNKPELYPTLRKTFVFKFYHSTPASLVFPLLCPERQKDWLDGWSYEMKYSESGLIEQDCIFYTSTDSQTKDVWVVSFYDIVDRQIEFLRVSPEACVIKINMTVKDIKDQQAETEIIYTYTALNPRRAFFLEHYMEPLLQKSVNMWGESLNRFLEQ